MFARALEDTDLIAQLVNLDGRLGGVVTDQVHNVARFGESLSRREPSSGRKRGRGHATQTESAPRHHLLIEGRHEFLLIDVRRQPPQRRGTAASRLPFEM